MSNVFSSQNPATGETIWEGAESTGEHIDISVIRAKKAFESWSLLSFEKREEYLKRYQKILEKEKDSLALAISTETGKPLWEARSEAASMIGKVDISIEAYRERCRTTSTTRHKPHGVAAVFGPFNFPGHLPNGHIVPALLAGNTIIFKPSELTPLVGEKICELFKQAKFPEGVINLVQGGPETGRPLSHHPQIDALFFTGSYHTGKKLSEYFGSHPEKILALEMGGNNPLVVSRVADLKAAAYMTLQSAFITTGQRCSCARRLIVIENQNSSLFVETLVEAAKKLKIGPFNQSPEPFMGPLIHSDAARKVLQAQEDLIAKGARPLLTAKKLTPDLPFISPGIIDATRCKEISDREIFGPLLQLIKVSSLDEAIHEAANTAYGLTAGILSDDKAEFETFFQSVKAGVINWNTPTTGASSGAPFGGVGKSGNHRPSAFYAADYCAYPVATISSNELKLSDVRLPGVEL